MKRFIVMRFLIAFYTSFFGMHTASAFEDHLLPSEYLVDVRNFGAVGDGQTDDTAAIQAAVDSMLNTGGDVLMHGEFLSGAVAFPSIPQWLRIHLDGTWTLKEDSTLVVPPYVWINGRGGTTIPSQGTLKPQAEITASHSGPAVKMTGSGPKGISNLSVGNYGSGPAILLQNGMSFVLDNVYAAAVNSYALRLDGASSVAVSHCIFGVSPDGEAEASIYITTSSDSPERESGNVSIDRCLISSKGILIAAERPVSEQSFFNFSSIVYENGRSPFFTLDGTNGSVRYVTLDKAQIADAVGAPSFIEVRGPEGGVADVAFKDIQIHAPAGDRSGASAGSFVGGGSIKGLNVYVGLPAYDFSSSDIGTQMSEDSTVIRNGEFITEFNWYLYDE